jgi:hypothetical protein
VGRKQSLNCAILRDGCRLDFGFPVKFLAPSSEGLNVGENCILRTEAGIWLSLLNPFANVSIQLFIFSSPGY